MHDMADDVTDLLDRVRSAKNQEKHARSLAVAFAGKVLPDIITNQLLGGAMPRILGGHDLLGIAPDEFLARGKHTPPNKVEPSAGYEPGKNAAGAGFAHRVGSDDDVGKFFGLHKNPERLNRLSRGWQAIEVARTGGR